MKTKSLTLILIFSLLLSGCGAPSGMMASDTAVTFTDDLGRSITVDNPQRVAALLGSFAQVWQLAGGEVVATADDAWEDLKLTMSADAVNLGSTENLSLELLLSSQPDFVLAAIGRRQHLEWRDTLEAARIPVAYFEIDDFDDYLRLLKICTDITGCKDLFEANGAAVQAQIDVVLARSRERLAAADVPSVLCLTASASRVRAQNSQGTVLGAMLKALGCVNIADSETMLLENVSIEHILQADPDYIFIVQRGDDAAGMREYVQQYLMDHPAWAQLTAVKNDRVYFMDKLLYNLKPNHRWGEAYEKLEEILSNG